MTGKPVVRDLTAKCVSTDAMTLNYVTFECQTTDDTEALRWKLSGKALYFERVATVLGSDAISTAAFDGVLKDPFPQDTNGVNIGIFDGSKVNEPHKIEASSSICEDVSINFPQDVLVQWGLDRIDQERPPLDGVFNVHDNLIGCGVQIYVADTGLNTNHKDFEGRVGQGADFTESISREGYVKTVEDENGHGEN